MALGIQAYVAGLSLSNTVDLLDVLGCPTQSKSHPRLGAEADLQPEPGQNPNHIDLDETVIRIDDQ